MTSFQDLVDQMFDHANQAAPNEACGLLVKSSTRGRRLIRAANKARSPREDFELDPEAWLEVADDERVAGIYHSHPSTGPEPSVHDLVQVEAWGLPWFIVSLATQTHVKVEPSGYQAPYEGRPYVHGLLDCYSVIRDWYQREWGLGLPNYERQDGWWNEGKNLYLDNFEANGFKAQPLGTSFEVGDAFLIQRRSKVPNHAAVYVGEDQILHHEYRRLSKVEGYAGSWRERTTHHLRHVSRGG